MTTGMWYRWLVENNVTHRVTASGREELMPCRIEMKHPELNWDNIWSLSTTSGLPSTLLTFLWRMIHDLLPCQTRLFRLRMPNIISEVCTHCDLNVAGDTAHSLVLCPYNGGAGLFLLNQLHKVLPQLQPHQVVKLDLHVEQDLKLPLTFLISSVLLDVWECRRQKKPCHLHTIRAALEAGVNILRKSRHSKAALKLADLLEIV